MSGFDDLDRMIGKLQQLEQLAGAAAPDCARAVKEVLDSNINKGVDPYGKAWELRKDTGKKPLQNADQHLYVAAVGNDIIMRVKGPEARHHLGTAKGGTVRKVIPTEARLPTNLVEAIARTLAMHFERITGGGR